MGRGLTGSAGRVGPRPLDGRGQRGPSDSGLAAGPRPLPRAFFARPATAVAPDLLGCVITHETTAGVVTVTLAEVEAYAGDADPASHAFRGRTARNAVMFGPPGHLYVYLTYGMHFCMNLVCQPEGRASAVLLRSGWVIDGVPLAGARRVGGGRIGTAPRDIDLARGPARLCQALGIDRSHNGADLCDPDSPLRVHAPQAPVAAAGISSGPRVGVSRAADVAWRFWISGDPAVSAYRAYAPRRTRGKPVTTPEAEGGTIPQ